jgi:spore coat polysaccharide biosynthesis protein SpsF (cytidylyltransferase family)|tara:strand:- start:331 stop:831 length:501 start_codon:yes stop_codon:yes gene_type:complete
MNIVCIVQARVRSTRLFGKVLREVQGRALIDVLLHRLSRSRGIDRIIVATGEDIENDVLATKVEKLGHDVFRGSEEDVLDRYFKAARCYGADAVVRITGDCPLIDPAIVDDVIDLYRSSDVDYCSNTTPPTFPDGLDVELFSFESLKGAWENAVTIYDREHVTPYI